MSIDPVQGVVRSGVFGYGLFRFVKAGEAVTSHG